MKPVIELDGATVFHGSCLDVLPTLPDESVDAVVCDPPYELGFMGKKWDSTGIAYDVNVWRECLRVSKPGGHLLAFGGSRTWHRLAVAIEDSGFEIRDSVAWLYGSGFPKSLDVSKAIDKGTGENLARQLKFTAWMRASGLTSSRARDALVAAGLITEKSNQAAHYFAETVGSQPAVATADMFDALRPYLPEVPEEIERLVAERTGIEWTAYKQREVIGQGTAGLGKGANGAVFEGGYSDSYDITAPATPEAVKWQGWGTALKPAFEPVVVARKRLIGTVAENVLAYGTGGLNIDGTRIGTDDTRSPASKSALGMMNDDAWKAREVMAGSASGRWPSNVMLDEFTAGLLDEQSGTVGGGFGIRGKGGNTYAGGNGFANTLGETGQTVGYGNSGGASRFFYVAKAFKRDRNEGLDGLPEQRGGTERMNNSNGRKAELGEADRLNKTKNFHPTVKPTDLMRQLIRLVTPPGGVVLDPFTGSGSTGKATILEGFTFIGIELTEEYLPIIEGRLRHAIKTCDEARQQVERETEESLW